MAFSENEWFAALSNRYGEELTHKYANATVAICGLGGLGSNIAVALARAGIGKLILIDFDRVDLSNLHRQQYKVQQIGLYKTEALAENLTEIAPFLKVVTYCEKMDEDNISELLKDADVVCEAFDNAEAKAMLTNKVLECMPDKFLVAASGMAGLDSANLIKTRKAFSKLYLCGDGVSEVSASEMLMSSRVMLCAAHQAHAVLRILAGKLDADEV